MVLANGLLGTPYAKTTYGLLRGPSRFSVRAVIDPDQAGRDAGELVDGRPRSVPVLRSLADAVEEVDAELEVCVVGVATVGGVLPPALRADLLAAARLGMTLVNGMHELLTDDPELQAICRQSGAEIVDIRRPKPIDEMRFWTGEVLDLRCLRVAVLGTDCAVGKRTTATRLWRDCNESGLEAALLYTGQTGWLQGFEHGFILDATPNDFVCGELERALVGCQRLDDPDLVLIEGQSGLRNPSGPCGSELVLGAGAHGVILQHVPGRRYYKGLEVRSLRIPTLDSEVALIESLGAPVWGITINPEGLEPAAAESEKARLRRLLSRPVVDPFVDGVEPLVDRIAAEMKARNE